MIIGAVIGAFLGGVYGESSYNYNFAKSEYANENSENFRKYLYGILGAMPFGLLGGIIGPIIIKKTFIINGDRGRMIRVMQSHM